MSSPRMCISVCCRVCSRCFVNNDVVVLEKGAASVVFFAMSMRMWWVSAAHILPIKRTINYIVPPLSQRVVRCERACQVFARVCVCSPIQRKKKSRCGWQIRRVLLPIDLIFFMQARVLDVKRFVFVMHSLISLLGILPSSAAQWFRELFSSKNCCRILLKSCEKRFPAKFFLAVHVPVVSK